MAPRTILVPIDFADSSDAALAYALDFAKAFGSQIIVLHAYETPVTSYADGTMIATAELTHEMLDAAKVGVSRIVEQIAERVEGSSIAVRGIVKQGTPWRAILEAVDEVDADLVVMGTHGRHGLSRALLGSVAEKVVRAAHIPVLTVRQGCGEAA